MRYHISPQSSNTKTGPLVVTTTGAQTCPSACPLKGKGCYAKYSFLGLFWRKVTGGALGHTFPVFLKALAYALAKNPAGIWRHNQAGDLPGAGNRVDARKLAALAAVSAASGRKGFTYTHKPVRAADVPTGSPAQRRALAAANLKAVRAAVAAGFTINLSANNPAHADALAATGLPVCVTVAQSTPETFFTPDGRKGVVCPAQTRSEVSCATCRLCSNEKRPVLIGFRFHGSGAGAAAAATKGGSL
jgi:hypothetical protein